MRMHRVGWCRRAPRLVPPTAGSRLGAIRWAASDGGDGGDAESGGARKPRGRGRGLAMSLVRDHPWAKALIMGAPRSKGKGRGGDGKRQPRNDGKRRQRTGGDVGKNAKTRDDMLPDVPTIWRTYDSAESTSFAESVEDRSVLREAEEDTSDAPYVDVPATPMQYDNLSSQVQQPAVAQLHHGLEEVVAKPGLHLVKHLKAPFLATRLHQPEEVNFDALPPFVTSSHDAALTRLAADNGSRFVMSTSSAIPILSLMSHMLAGYRTANLGPLPSFRAQTHKFARMFKPSCSLLRPMPNSSVLALDAESGNRTRERILMDMGKSLERMLTMDQASYERYLLKCNNPHADLPPEWETGECYNYMRAGRMLVRSQLDCYDANLPGNGTFDLKTRAMHAVRMNLSKHRSMSHIRLDRLMGVRRSYELEFYDLTRGALLKYALQARLGQMEGIFMAYHNTHHLFGFEFLPMWEMDRAVHWTEAWAQRSFDLSMYLLERVMEAAAEPFPGQPVRITCCLRKSARAMDVYVEHVAGDTGWDEDSVESPHGRPGVGANGFPVVGNEIHWFRFRVQLTTKDGIPIHGPVPVDVGEDVQASYQIEDLTQSVPMDKLVSTYQQALQSTALFSEYAMPKRRK